MRNVIRLTLHYADIVVRAVAAVSLIPLAVVTLFVSIMANDAPGALFPGFLVFGIGVGMIMIIWVSCVEPDYWGTKLERYLPHYKWIGRAPAYLVAPFGLYYGPKILIGIAVKLF